MVIDNYVGPIEDLGNETRESCGDAHMEVSYVKLGEPVQRGHIISLSGCTGDSTGFHVRDEACEG